MYCADALAAGRMCRAWAQLGSSQVTWLLSLPAQLLRSHHVLLVCQDFNTGWPSWEGPAAQMRRPQQNRQLLSTVQPQPKPWSKRSRQGPDETEAAEATNLPGLQCGKLFLAPVTVQGALCCTVRTLYLDPFSRGLGSERRCPRRHLGTSSLAAAGGAVPAPRPCRSAPGSSHTLLFRHTCCSTHRANTKRGARRGG